MKDNNRIIQSLWIGGSLSIMEQLCIKSFQKNGHEFHLYTYNDVTNVPKDTIIRDGNEILSRNNIFFDNRNSVASFSDWFRYKMLYDKGGWWVDMDSVCLQYFNFEDDYCFATETNGVGNIEITNAIIKAPTGSDFLLDCLENIDKYIFINKKSIQWGAFGPTFLRKILGYYEHQPYVKSPEVFCPIPWKDTANLISGEFRLQLSPSIFAIHLWNEIWRLRNLNKNTPYHPDSILEKLKKSYL